MTDVCSLQMERDRLRGELASATAANKKQLDDVLGLLKYASHECDRLRTELAEQKRLNLQLAERLRACSEALGRVAEKGGKVSQGDTGREPE